MVLGKCNFCDVTKWKLDLSWCRSPQHLVVSYCLGNRFVFPPTRSFLANFWASSVGQTMFRRIFSAQSLFRLAKNRRPGVRHDSSHSGHGKARTQEEISAWVESELKKGVSDNLSLVFRASSLLGLKLTCLSLLVFINPSRLFFYHSITSDSWAPSNYEIKLASVLALLVVGVTFLLWAQIEARAFEPGPNDILALLLHLNARHCSAGA